jgi:predicted alpha/beta-hydrolase family hydrolase
MSTRNRFERRHIAIDGGESVSAVVAWPQTPVSDDAPAVILAHGAGNGMQSPFLSAVHEGLARRGYVAVKFNFPYMERARRAPDRPAVLEACYRHVLRAVRNDAGIGARRIVIGGKSLGGRMASHLAAAGEAIAGLILLGYPLHAPHKTDQLRIAHLGSIRAPMLFFCGTRDALCDLQLLREVLGSLSAPVALHVIEGGDHSFNLPKSMRRRPAEVWTEIVDVGARWLEQLPR